MELHKPKTDQLLQAIIMSNRMQNHGKLKNFRLCRRHKEKTYAMLQAAHQARERGIDVVAGYIETYTTHRQRHALRTGTDGDQGNSIYNGRCTL